MSTIRTVALIALLICSETIAATVPGYYKDGRAVKMGKSDDVVFFHYVNVKYDYWQGLALDVAHATIDGMKRDKGYSSQFTKKQQEIIDNIIIRPTRSNSTGYFSVESGGHRYIDIPDVAAYELAATSLALADTSIHSNEGFLNLFVMSEVDWFKGKSPRWYDPRTYYVWSVDPKVYIGEAPVSNISDPITIKLIANTMQLVIIHEICHHLLDHTVAGRGLIRAARQRGDFAGAAELSQKMEIDADYCAADINVKYGGAPGLGMTAALLVQIISGDTPSDTHPTSEKRIKAMKKFDDKFVDDAVSRGAINSSRAATSKSVTDLFYGVLLKYQKLYGTR